VAVAREEASAGRLGLARGSGFFSVVAGPEHGRRGVRVLEVVGDHPHLTVDVVRDDVGGVEVTPVADHVTVQAAGQPGLSFGFDLGPRLASSPGGYLAGSSRRLAAGGEALGNGQGVGQPGQLAFGQRRESQAHRERVGRHEPRHKEVMQAFQADPQLRTIPGQADERA
jgi:hypothetical protein